MANRKFEFDTDGFQYYNDNYVKHPSKSATTGTSGAHPYNGMGRVVLKKNMVSNVNTLTQAMINTANTIYVIQYDFTLGEDITIPANCVLDFQGGSIGGGIVFSNKTILLGTPKMEKWFGAFKDSLGNWLDHDLMPFNIKVKKEAYVSVLDFVEYGSNYPYNSHQSMAVYNDYIFIAAVDTNDVSEGEYRNLIVVVDKNYNPIGITKLNFYGHANGIGIDKDGYLINPSRANNSYYKVSADTIVQNARTNSPTETGEVVSMQTLTQNYCYDTRTGNSLWMLDADRNFYIYKDNNIIKKLAHPSDYYFKGESGSNRGRQQTSMVNGIIYQIFAYSYDYVMGYLSVIDAQSEELITTYVLDFGSEVEGIFFNNDIFYISGKNTYFYKLGTHGDEFEAVEDYKNTKNSPNVYFHVNNKYTGPKRGTSDAPFGNLQTALFLANGLNNATIRLYHSEKPYSWEYSLPTGTCKLTIDSIDDNHDDIIINGRLALQGDLFLRRVVVDGVNAIDTAIINRRWASDLRITIDSCTIKNYTGNFVSSVNSNLIINNSEIKDCGSPTCTLGSIRISSCIIENMNGSIGGRQSNSTVLSNNTYDNCNITASGSFSNVPILIAESNAIASKDLEALATAKLIVGDDGCIIRVLHSNSTPDDLLGLTWVRGDFYISNNASRINLLSNLFPFRTVDSINALEYKYKRMFLTATTLFKRISAMDSVRPYQINDDIILELTNNDGSTKYSPSGTTRPDMHYVEDIGKTFYDTSINKLLFWNGTAWVDATGTPV